MEVNMYIITSQKLFDKYPQNTEELKTLLNSISPNVDILPYIDFLSVRQHIGTIDDSIVIIGNDDVINFPRLPNPAGDGDDVVLSDNGYSCMTDPMYLIPSKVVTRIPDDMDNPNFANLKAMLMSQAAWLKNKTPNTGWVNFVASVWKGISDYFNTEFNMNSQFVIPPADNIALGTDTRGKKFCYGNTHGAKQTPYFYGQFGNTFPIALEPTIGNFNGTLAFFEACYGGYTIDRSAGTSIPMMALVSGSIGCVCSTSIAYGPAAGPPQSADLLFECFFKRILAGENLGNALMHAKQDFATQTIKNFGSMNGAARKTLLQFHLYGLSDIII